MGNVTPKMEEKRLMARNDPSLIWKAINWKGEISDKEPMMPSDDQLSVYFKNLLNFNTDGQSEPNLNSAPYVPVLDDPFTPLELDTVLKDINARKSYTGICPGLLGSLPITWIMYLLTLFNIIFQ